MCLIGINFIKCVHDWYLVLLYKMCLMVDTNFNKMYMIGIDFIKCVFIKFHQASLYILLCGCILDSP